MIEGAGRCQVVRFDELRDVLDAGVEAREGRRIAVRIRIVRAEAEQVELELRDIACAPTGFEDRVRDEVARAHVVRGFGLHETRTQSCERRAGEKLIDASRGL